MPRISSISIASVAMAAVLWGCATSVASGPPTEPVSGASASPTASTDRGPLDHPSGATDVVFRFEEGGGFVPMDFFATAAPTLTLYGDGTVVFQGGSGPTPAADGTIRVPAYRTAHLAEDEIQAWLQSAIVDGGLGVARPSYDAPGADLPTATFFIAAGGVTKTVSVLGLGMDRAATDPNRAVLLALGRLGDRVRTFGVGRADVEDWVPARWRGLLLPGGGGGPGAARPWPWPGLTPAEFVRGTGPNAPGFPARTMSVEEVATLGIGDLGGGVSGLALVGPDGTPYGFALRPLFPDEAA